MGSNPTVGVLGLFSNEKVRMFQVNKKQYDFKTVKINVVVGSL